MMTVYAHRFDFEVSETPIALNRRTVDLRSTMFTVYIDP